jgi:hypothetical protein
LAEREDLTVVNVCITFIGKQLQPKPAEWIVILFIAFFQLLVHASETFQILWKNISIKSDAKYA